MTVQRDGLTERLVDHTLGLKYESLPSEVRERTKQLFLDYLGVSLGGRAFGDSPATIIQGVQDLLKGRQGPCTVVGETTRYPAHFAAMLNCSFAHVMDFDDTGEVGGHPGGPVFSVLMALAEEAAATGGEFLTAAVGAYDVVGKIARAVGDGIAKRGFEPSATTGIFGATAGAARLLGLSREQALNALGINGSQAAGSEQFLEKGGWNKPLQLGLAAHNAVYALAMARREFKGAIHPLEGRFGYFFSYSADGWDPTKTTGLGTDFEVMTTAIKPYPSCRLNHGPIDAAVALVRQHRLAPEDVASIDVYISPFAHQMVGEPVALKRNPSTVEEGLFSLYFATAAAVTGGEFTWESYSKLDDPAVGAIMQVTSSHPTTGVKNHTCRMAIKTRDGQVLSKEIPVVKGDPGDPLTWDETVSKFTSLAQGTLGQGGAQRVVEAVAELERREDFSRFTELLRP